MVRWKHDKVDNIQIPCDRKLQVDTKNFNALKLKILFYSIINMKIIFHFNIIILKNKHLHVDLNKICKITSTCRKFLTLQNGLLIDKTLNFVYFQVKLWEILSAKITLLCN
jgi:hypothetical protein